MQRIYKHADMKTELISSVKGGKLQPTVTKQLLHILSGLEGKKVVITIEKLTAKRSLQQNKYMHLLFSIFTESLNELGNNFTTKEVKELCKAKFALVDVANEQTGEILGQRIKATSEMNKEELGIFIDKVIQWASEFNIKLPLAGEQLLIE